MKQGTVKVVGLSLGNIWALAGSCVLVMGLVALSSGTARADDIDQWAGKLIDMDNRAGSMVYEIKDAQPASPDVADRRVIDAQVLFSLKNYEEAATILLDVVDKYPGTRAYDDAIALLGESLYQALDFYSARPYLEKAVAKKTGTKAETHALQRLIEISLRTGDYEHIDEYLARLQNVPLANVEPSVPYVRAKYYYFSGKLDEAMNALNVIAPSNPYYLQARYFQATIQVKRGDLAGASITFDSIIKQQAPDDSGKDIQDLSRMAIARLLYERSQFDKAIEAYASVPRQSKYFGDALQEQAWTFIKAKEWQKAYRALDLLLLASPDTPDAPQLRLLMGNLNLRMSNFFLASDAFGKVRDEFEPVHRQLQQIIVRSQADPAYFDTLVGKNLDKFDIAAFVPPEAARWVRAEPDVVKMTILANGMGEMQRDLTDSQKLVERIDKAMKGTGRAGIFPDLASARTKSVEMLNAAVDIRQKLAGKLRAIIDPTLSAEERKQLDVIAVQRDGLQRQLTNAPTTDAGVKSHEAAMKAGYGDLDRQASEANVEIQSLDAQLVAIESYYRSSRIEQKIRPEDIQGPIHDLRAAIDELHATHDQIREAIVDASREATTAGAAGDAERGTARQLDDLLRQEASLEDAAKMRLSSNDRVQADRIGGLMARCDSIQGKLNELDKKVDAQVDVRLVTVRKYLDAEKDELASAGGKLGTIVDASKGLGGGLAQAMFAKVADKFYDLVVRSDVGIIDVSWGLKDQKTAAVNKLTNQKNAEMKALDEDFRKVLEDDK
ncbi:MAG TPA: tetratricopeptide repeat protein [Polyangia bacterium]|jgi:tetratricopeptide (TPR) repeat protein|nr:tetratricopeptide repeat protein [Polyangia bacterium]